MTGPWNDVSTIPHQPGGRNGRASRPVVVGAIAQGETRSAAERFPLGRRQFLPKVHLRRGAARQTLMEPLMVVEVEVGRQAGLRHRHRRIVHQVDMLILDRAPEPLDKDVVQVPAPPMGSGGRAGLGVGPAGKDAQQPVARKGDDGAPVAVQGRNQIGETGADPPVEFLGP